MPQRIYSIILQTSIGDRPGTMEVQIGTGRVNGRLNVLKQSEPFEGSVDENGNCRIRGRLVTLRSSLPYIASGEMGADSLRLYLEGEGFAFPVVGTILQPGRSASPKTDIQGGNADANE